jgi:hypothetical protein
MEFVKRNPVIWTSAKRARFRVLCQSNEHLTALFDAILQETQHLTVYLTALAQVI